jgi:hypothetical protein
VVRWFDETRRAALQAARAGAGLVVVGASPRSAVTALEEELAKGALVVGVRGTALGEFFDREEAVAAESVLFASTDLRMTLREADRRRFAGKRMTATVAGAGDILELIQRLREERAAGVPTKSLTAIAAVRVVPALCTGCLEPDEEAARAFGDGARRKGPGCTACAGQGHAGELAFAEILELTTKTRLRFEAPEFSAPRITELAAAEAGFRPIHDQALDAIMTGRVAAADAES